MPISCHRIGKVLPQAWQSLATAMAKVCQGGGKMLAKLSADFIEELPLGYNTKIGEISLKRIYQRTVFLLSHEFFAENICQTRYFCNFSLGLRIMNRELKILSLLAQFKELDIDKQIDYDKFYLYSIITHSTAIEGSTVTEVENQLLFDEGISAKGRSMAEQLMNLDLKAAYEQSIVFARNHSDISIKMIRNY